ncbi:MAG: HAD family phosphatase [Pseudomonadota bacterium]
MPALLFDLDGTLLHSDALHYEIFAEIFLERGRTLTMDQYFDQIHGRRNVDFLPEFFPDVDAERLGREKEDRFRARLSGDVPAMPGAAALIDRALAGGWGLAVVTNAPRANAEHMLQAIGLRDAFDVLIIGEDCTRAKPDPEPYIAAMEALSARPDACLAFEDSPSGTRAARASGAYTVGILSSAGHDALSAAGAHETLIDFTDPRLEQILAFRHRKADT